jgi:hypothetical protein
VIRDLTADVEAHLLGTYLVIVEKQALQRHVGLDVIAGIGGGDDDDRPCRVGGRQPSDGQRGHVGACLVDARRDEVENAESHRSPFHAAAAQHLPVHLREGAVDSVQPTGVGHLQGRAHRGHVRAAATAVRRGP